MLDKPHQNILCLLEILPPFWCCKDPRFIPFDELTGLPGLVKW